MRRLQSNLQRSDQRSHCAGIWPRRSGASSRGTGNSPQSHFQMGSACLSCPLRCPWSKHSFPCPNWGTGSSWRKGGPQRDPNLKVGTGGPPVRELRMAPMVARTPGPGVPTSQPRPGPGGPTAQPRPGPGVPPNADPGRAARPTQTRAPRSSLPRFCFRNRLR